MPRRRKPVRSSRRPRRSPRVSKKRHESRLLTLFKLGLACLILWGCVGAVYYVLALRYNLAEMARMPERTLIYDADDRLYTRLSGENRIVIGFDQVPEHFVKALLAREDTRFYQHLGVDPIGIARAALRNLLMGGIRQGGSTITQQLARNSFPLGGRNYHRKLLEAALSFRIETELSKEEILESYINRIYFGSGCYGIETASRMYFDKPASALTLAESALLAGLIRSPTRLSPLNNPEGSLQQREVVLGRMRELGWITPEERAGAMQEPLRLSKKPRPPAPTDNWAMDAVRREMESILAEVGYETGGLLVYTTIDPALQRVTEASISRRLEAIESLSVFPHASRREILALRGTDYLQAAVMALDHRNGAVLAIAGGRDFSQSRFNRVYFGRRQAGSVVKPFVLAHAFTRGMNPRTPISDGRILRQELPPNTGTYDPANPDGKYDGDRPAGDVVVHSRNTMAVRVGLRAGLGGLADILRRAGLGDPPIFPSITLGAFETTLRDLTSAMTAFPNGGNQVHPFVIRKITTQDGRVLYQHRQVRTPLLDPEASRQVTMLMEEVMTRGTASGSRAMGLRGRAAGKTGTTNDFQDAWFVGFTGNLTIGVWAGFDRPRTIYPGGGGAQVALPIWVDLVSSPPAKRYR